MIVTAIIIIIGSIVGFIYMDHRKSMASIEAKIDIINDDGGSVDIPEIDVTTVTPTVALKIEEPVIATPKKKKRVAKKKKSK